MNQEIQKQAAARAETVRKILNECTLCPRQCKVNRTTGEKGYCGLDDTVRCFREMLYRFEESAINPSHQVYFAGCNLRCEFCAVAEWNEQPDAAPEIDYKQTALKTEQRKRQGAKVLNLLGGEPAVSMHGIFELLAEVSPDMTVVLNTNMYFSGALFVLLDGFIDIYLADFKCGNDICAKNILQADNYCQVVGDNISAAAKQADVIVRHLALPGHFECCTKEILNRISKDYPKVRVSLRRDYVPPIRPTTVPDTYLGASEYSRAVNCARNLGLNLIE